MRGCDCYLGVAPLICEITGVDENIAVGELDGGVVRVGDAEDAGTA